MANQVTLTFAGETRGVEQSFDRVGAASRDMERDVNGAASGFDRASEAADVAEGRAQGFSSTLTGTADTAAGVGEIMKGNLFEGFVMVGGGLADLAEGFAYTLIPWLRSSVTWLRGTRVGMLATAGAQKVWTAAQWLFNASLLASPITWIIVGIVALVAVIVLIARRTDWFSRAWRASWSWIKNAAANTWDFVKKIPGWVGSAFSGIARSVSGPFRAAFNWIARAWNATVGGLSFTVPGWVPVIGGNSFSVPRLRTFHTGGIVPGVVGTPTVALLQAGERVSSTASGSGSGSGEQWIRIDLGELGAALLEPIAREVRRRGGTAGALGVRVVDGMVRA